MRSCNFVSNNATFGGVVWALMPLDIENCVFEDNSSVNQGGAVYSEHNLSCANSRFIGNASASEGGAVSTTAGETLMVGCEFEGNQAATQGGAVYCQIDLLLSNCLFIANASMESAGAIYMETGELTTESCDFIGNQAGAGGAIYGSVIAATGCNFVSNQANWVGAVYCSDDSTFVGCRFANNDATDQSAGAIYGFSVTAEDCDFEGNGSSEGGGAATVNAASAFRGCRFVDNHTADDGGAVNLICEAGGSTLESCRFESNHGGRGGGAVMIWSYHNLIPTTRVVRCEFVWNEAGSGGAVSVHSPCVIENSLFKNNWGYPEGAALSVESAGCILNNCTITDHDQCAAVYASNATLNLVNNIGWYNYDSPTLVDSVSSAVRATNCCIEGTSPPGSGNISVDPQFVCDGWHISTNSPCLDAGLDLAGMDSQTDLDGQARIYGGTVDIGADERGAPGTNPDEIDTDGDGLTDLYEICAGLDPDDPDMDDDGLSDGEEINLSDTNPFDFDSDDDGFSDGDEYRNYGTNPNDADTDDDDMPDGWEVGHGLNPSDPDDAFADPDRDIVPNLWECHYDTDPASSNSVPPATRVVAADGSGDHLTLQAAYNAASDLEIIDVRAGTYQGHGWDIVLDACDGKRIVWKAEMGPADDQRVTLIHDGNGPTVVICGGDTVLAGFAINYIPGGNWGFGGGVTVHGSRARLVNCRISGGHFSNTIEYIYGQALYNGNAVVELIHCTVFGNQSLTGEALIFNDSTSAVTRVINSIIWNENQTAPELRPGNYQYVVSNSIIRGGAHGSIDQNPLLTPMGWLTAGSPARDLGGDVIPLDVHGESRPFGAGADLGWDEFVDADADGLPDRWEILYFGNIVSQTGLGDADGDGLTNQQEYCDNANPAESDTDGDGLLDGYDIAIGSGDPRYAAWTAAGIFYSEANGLRTFSGELSVGTLPLNPDTDGDGLIDGGELLHGADPFNPDTDADGLLDGAEILTYQTSPIKIDTDGEGLLDGNNVTVGAGDSRYVLWANAGIAYAEINSLRTFKGELSLGTAPADPDTDDDGLLDGYDVAVGTSDPRYSLWAAADILFAETNGLRTFKGELGRGTNPLNPDTDGGGVPDGWEVANGLDPLDATDDMGDPDGDGFGSAYEWYYDTDPNDDQSVPAPLVIHVDAQAAAGGNGSATNPYATIQAALNVASNYAVVVVADGIYRGTGNKNLQIPGKPLILESVTGAAKTVIDCEYDGRGMTFQNPANPRTVLRGFAVIRATQSAILCNSGASPSIEGCVLTGNMGTGVECGSGAGPAIRNCTVANNQGCGVARSAGSGPCPAIENTILWGNSSQIQGNVATVRFSCVQGGWSGTGNLSSDPRLVASGCHVTTSSPCIDAGMQKTWPKRDMDGEAPWDHPSRGNLVSIEDIGADEFVDGDGDGMPDWWETENGLDPDDSSDADDDPDGDLLANLAEYERGSQPGIVDPTVDSDGDGMVDWWEAQNGLNPGNPADAGGDLDGDGLSNLEEFQSGTDPHASSDAVLVLNESRARIISQWNLLYETTPQFQHPPGSSEDLNDLKSALLGLSGKFYSQEEGDQ